MERRWNDAAEMDAQIKPRTGECAKDMEQSTNYVAAKDAQISRRKEECALGMAERHYAAVKVAQMVLSEEECALDMGERSNYAASKEVQLQIKSRKEDFVEGTGLTKCIIYDSTVHWY